MTYDEVAQLMGDPGALAASDTPGDQVFKWERGSTSIFVTFQGGLVADTRISQPLRPG